MPGDRCAELALTAGGPGDRYAVAGRGAAVPDPGVSRSIIIRPTSACRPGICAAGAHSYTAFFTESFVDELAQVAGNEPLSFRIGMLGGEPRLARCLSTAAALGGWEGGVAGSGQGIACHAFRGSYIAVLAEAQRRGRARSCVDRLVAAVDCGRVVNPDLVRQQIEGGLIFGMAAALGARDRLRGRAGRGAGLRRARPAAAGRHARHHRRADRERRADPAGSSELGGARRSRRRSPMRCFAATGLRLRTLPLRPGDDDPASRPSRRFPHRKIGVLLVNLGTPDAPDARVGAALSRRVPVRPARRRNSRRSLWQPILRGIILDTRPKKSAHAYAQVWTRGRLAARRDHARAGGGAAGGVRRRA